MTPGRVEETAEQFEARMAGQEVFSRDEIRFDDALEVVKKEMLKRIRECRDKIDQSPRIDFSVLDFSEFRTLQGFVADCGHDYKSDVCATPAEAIAELIEGKPNKAKIARLQAELARLQETQ